MIYEKPMQGTRLFLKGTFKDSEVNTHTHTHKGATAHTAQFLPLFPNFQGKVCGKMSSLKMEAQEAPRII